VVASVGNDGEWGNPELIPAACPNTVTVSALTPSFGKTYWSSFDATVDLAAPGQDVLSVRSSFSDGEPTPHMLASGTSMAAPVVSGVAALLRSEHPAWGSDRIVRQMTDTAQDLGVPGPDADTGWGIVDAAAAVGVSGSPAAPSDFFTTWGWDPGQGRTVLVSWTTPQVHPVTGYTVTVHRKNGTTQDYQAGAGSVRQKVRMGLGAGWTVTAHTSAGDVTTYPELYRFRVKYGGIRPERLRVVGIERGGEHVALFVDRPDAPRSIDKIRLFIDVEGHDLVRRSVEIDHSIPFPKALEFRMPTGSRWYDLAFSMEVTNTNASGAVLGGDWQNVRRRAAAVHGSRIDQVRSAGRHAVSVVGGVSPIRSDRACAKERCEGQRATLVIGRGAQRQHVRVRYDSSGHFYATVWVPLGAHGVRLRVDGPRYLDSGSLQRYAIGS
jgi:hypothetical protein